MFIYIHIYSPFSSMSLNFSHIYIYISSNGMILLSGIWYYNISIGTFRNGMVVDEYHPRHM